MIHANGRFDHMLYTHKLLHNRLEIIIRPANHVIYTYTKVYLNPKMCTAIDIRVTDRHNGIFMRILGFLSLEDEFSSI